MPRRPKLSGVVPFGWALRAAEDGPSVLEPVPHELEALQRAFAYLDNGASFRETARWLTAKTKRAITYAGLQYLYGRRTQLAEGAG